MKTLKNALGRLSVRQGVRVLPFENHFRRVWVPTLQKQSCLRILPALCFESLRVSVSVGLLRYFRQCRSVGCFRQCKTVALFSSM